MENQMLANAAGNTCILVLTGTSTQACDAKLLTSHLEKQTGRPVAIIDRFIGGPFDISYNPAKGRSEDLEKTVTELLAKGTQHIHVVAHSYASYEIVRFLSKRHPGSDAIRSVVLVNPAGFSGQRRYTRHCLRFLFLFIAREYLSGLNALARSGQRDYACRKLSCTTTLFVKTAANITRTMKEVVDIERDMIDAEISALVAQGTDISFVITTNDTLVSSEKTIIAVKDKASQLITFPGNHMDPLYNDDVMLGISGLLKQRLGSEA